MRLRITVDAIFPDDQSMVTLKMDEVLALMTEAAGVALTSTSGLRPAKKEPVKLHHHVSTEARNCDQCMAMAMDERK